MLRYVGLGERHYGDLPMPVHKRLNWEFLAIVRGKIGPVLADGHPAVPVPNILWLFPPGQAHGWTGEAGKKCEVIVIHFSSVPRALEQIVAERGPLVTPLRPADLRRLHRLAADLKQHYWQPKVESELHTTRALMDLCLLVLRGYQERRRPARTDTGLAKVAAAEMWLRENLTSSPSIIEAARSVGLSVSQLHRLFSRVRRESPQAVLNRLKIDRATEILGESNAKLHSVAIECGFSSASNLCRAFKKYKGYSPTKWRMETYIQYKRPSSATQADHTKHGRRYRSAN